MCSRFQCILFLIVIIPVFALLINVYMTNVNDPLEMDTIKGLGALQLFNTFHKGYTNYYSYFDGLEAYYNNPANDKIKYPYPSPGLRALNQLMASAPIVDIPPTHPDYIKVMRENFSGMGKVLGVDLVPKKYINEFELNGHYAAWVHYPGVDISDNADTILYLHGGGCISGSAEIYLYYFFQMSRASFTRVLGVDYSLGPEKPLPAGVDDAVAAYQYLINEKNVDPERIVIAGESGGGHLSLLTLQAIRDRGLPAPAGGWIISAQTDMAGESPSLITNGPTDPMIKVADPEEYRAMCKLAIGDADPKDPRVSAFYGSFLDLPPLYFTVSDAEVLRDDTIRVYEKLLSQINEANELSESSPIYDLDDYVLDNSPHLPHAYTIFVGFEILEIEEGMGRATGWIRKILNKL